MIVQKRAAGKNIEVYVGLQKGCFVQIKRVLFEESIRSYDDVIARVITRGRSVVKSVFQASLNDSYYQSLMEKMILKDSYSLSVKSHSAMESKIFMEMPENCMVFYLDSKTKWRLLAKLHDLTISIPTTFESFLFDYYKNYYPAEVVQYAFADPKLIKRVYATEQIEAGEKFYFEPLFFDSADEDFIVIANKANNSIKALYLTNCAA